MRRKQKMCIYSGIAAMILVTGFSRHVYGQGESKPSVVIDGVGVTLGMPEQVVMARLGRDHRLEKVRDDSGALGDMWGVESKQGPPWTQYGLVSFSEGKLTWARVSWADPTDRGALEFARAVLGALSTVANDFGTPCTLSVRKAVAPSAETNFANLLCGSKTVGISLVTSHDGRSTSSASVTEEVGAAGIPLRE